MSYGHSYRRTDPIRGQRRLSGLDRIHGHVLCSGPTVLYGREGAESRMGSKSYLLSLIFYRLTSSRSSDILGYWTFGNLEMHTCVSEDQTLDTKGAILVMDSETILEHQTSGVFQRNVLRHLSQLPYTVERSRGYRSTALDPEKSSRPTR